MYRCLSVLFIINFGWALDTPSTPPMLIWGIHTPKPESIFQYMKTFDLVKMLKPIHKDYMIVAYVAPELTAKDINCHSCFPIMSQILPVQYYSKVEKPLRALNHISRESTTPGLVWHTLPTDGSEIDLAKEIQCQIGRIHCFNFEDRTMPAHDATIAAVWDELKNCRVIHIYTALEEESQALKRRRFHSLSNRRQSKSEQVLFIGADGQKTSSKSLTILRHELVIVGVIEIILALEVKTGRDVRYNRGYVQLTQGKESLQLGLVGEGSAKDGFVLVLNTNMGNMMIECLPVAGNWHITRILFNGNATFYPRDMIFFSMKNSLCCQSITAYSLDGSRLSLFSFHLDVISKTSDSGFDPKYNAKPCWHGNIYLSPGLAQSIFTIGILLFVLAVGFIMLWDIGRNKYVQSIHDPDLHIKTDS